MHRYQIITFYEFKPLDAGVLNELREELKVSMREMSVKGTIILAEEGFNAAVCGIPDCIAAFVSRAEKLLETNLDHKSSEFDRMPFKRIDVKIKPEIVTLKQDVDMALGRQTHVPPLDWNRIVSDPETFVLDVRNDYECRTGTFLRAINPNTEKFSDLPQYAAENLDTEKHKRIAMFCTGGIRCEKFAPYLKHLGFDEVYQLKGGILRYLDEIPPEDSLWQGECFVFDERVSLDASLKKGSRPDLSQNAE